MSFANLTCEIDGSAPYAVYHDFVAGVLLPQYEDQPPQEICEYFRSIIPISLSVDGTPIPHDWFDIGLIQTEEEKGWSPTYYFVFSEGYFHRGVHVLELTIDVVGILCELVEGVDKTAHGEA